MTAIWAKRVLTILMTLSVLLALNATLVQQNIVNVLITVSAFFTFKFLWKNPNLMLASNWEEFGELVDNAKGKIDLTGSPLFFLTVFLCVLYIIVF